MGTGVANSKGGSFVDTLAAKGAAQIIESPGNIPGSENPQISSMIIRAKKGNKGVVFLGGSEAEASEANGFELAAGDAIAADILGAGKLWWNGTETGDKICVFWVGP